MTLYDSEQQILENLKKASIVLLKRGEGEVWYGMQNGGLQGCANGSSR